MIKVLGIVCILVIIYLLVMALVGLFFCKMTFCRHYKKGMIYKTKDRIYETADVDWFNAHKEETDIVSSKGLGLAGYLFLQKQPCKDWIIVIHGYSSQALNMANYAKNFYNMGYNVLAPELMGMGKSQGDFVSMAGYDADDIVLWIDYLNRNYENIKIGIFGVSMGGATVMNTLGKNLPANVELFIEDSGYVDLREELAYQLKMSYNISFSPIITASSVVAKLLYGFKFSDINMEKALRETRLPGLIMHGEEDDFVPPAHAQKAFELLRSPKEIKYFKGAKHIRAEHHNREEYWQTVKSFLEKYSSRFKGEQA